MRNTIFQIALVGLAVALAVVLARPKPRTPQASQPPRLAASAASLARLSDARLAEANAAFRLDGKPIHPGCLAEFAADASGDVFPRVMAVDVQACTQSEKYCLWALKTYQGILFYENTETKESFGYRYLGRTPDGIHVLDTWENWGGTGYFTAAMFVVFETRGFAANAPGPVPEGVGEKTASSERLVMRCLGQVGHGDRDDGRIELFGDTLLLGKSRYRDQDTFIDLRRLGEPSAVQRPAPGGSSVRVPPHVCIDPRALGAAKANRPLGGRLAVGHGRTLRYVFEKTAGGDGALRIGGACVRLWDVRGDGLVFDGGLLKHVFADGNGDGYLDLFLFGIAVYTDASGRREVSRRPVKCVLEFDPARGRYVNTIPDEAVPVVRDGRS